MSARMEVRGGPTPAELAALTSAIDTILAQEAAVEEVHSPARARGWRQVAVSEAVGEGAPWAPTGEWSGGTP